MSKSLLSRCRRNKLRRLSFVIVALLVGCSAGSKQSVPQGKVQGKVNYKGEPVTSGRIVLYMGQSGAGAEAEIQRDGSYAIDRQLPVGKYLVTILPPVEKGSAIKREIAAKDAAKNTDDWKLPKKFGQEKTSGLSIDVAVGNNITDLELKD